MKNQINRGEWAEGYSNIQTGCDRGCHYCFGCANAIRFKRATAESWTVPVLNKAKALRRYGKRKGTVMYPTSHDIGQNNIAASIIALRAMIDAGNQVLIVSKPVQKCIRLICDEFEDEKEQVLFRFTIGSANNSILKFWEPGATSFEERLSTLRLAFERGFQTSVSCEPMLDLQIGKVVDAVLPYVTDTVWLGRANNLRQIIALTSPGNIEVKIAANRLLGEQTDQWLQELYRQYSANPKIKFKNSKHKNVWADAA